MKSMNPVEYDVLNYQKTFISCLILSTAFLQKGHIAIKDTMQRYAKPSQEIIIKAKNETMLTEQIASECVKVKHLNH